jgi:GGDEF domain-containing protein
VGMSVGVALCPKDGTDGATLVDRADRALLLAKRTGKGRIRAYSPALAAGSQ